MAMPNTITNLLPMLYEVLDKVVREQVGFIPAVFRDVSGERAAVNEVIRWPVVPANTAAAISPAYIGPNATAQTIGSGTLTLSNIYGASFPWAMEETKGLKNGGFYDTMLRQQFEQAMRDICNKVEDSIFDLFVNASRAVKTQGTYLFDSTDKLGSLANLLRIFKDNGITDDLQLVLGPSAAALLRSTDFLFKVNEAGTSDMLRDGSIGRLMGFNIHESAQVVSHTNGTYTSAIITDNTLNGTALTGTTLGSLLAGDLLKINNDTSNVYVLKTPTSATVATINNPGCKLARTGASDAVNPLIATSYIPNVAFSRNSIALVARPPAGGDGAVDEAIITDDKSGLSLRVAKYAQYHQVSYEVSLVWGVAAVKSEGIAILAE